MSESAKWYVVHTYSGYENAVKTSIEKFVTGRGMEDMILRIEVPMETVTEVTDSGATKEVERKVFPGYVLIKMVMTDDTWHLVRNVRGVTGFVGSANKAIPLTEEEVLAMGMEKHEIVVRYNVGDHVKIVDGPLASFTGVVEEIEPEKNRVSVMVSMFGRETPVELELDHPYWKAYRNELDAPEFDEDYPSVDSFLHKYDEKVNELHTLARNLMQFIAPGAPETGAASAAQTAAPAQAGGASNTIEELKQYKSLLDAGVLTEEEFAAKKRQLLGI